MGEVIQVGRGHQQQAEVEQPPKGRRGPAEPMDAGGRAEGRAMERQRVAGPPRIRRRNDPSVPVPLADRKLP
eukprot:15439013-Alexandrium_andersonii.AAC.1